jgi:hypothetical protein
MISDKMLATAADQYLARNGEKRHSIVLRGLLRIVGVKRLEDVPLRERQLVFAALSSDGLEIDAPDDDDDPDDFG